MTDSGSGNYSLPPGYEAVTGQTILASQHNPPLEDIAAALNRRSFRDGRAPFTGDQNFNGYRATGAANAVNPQDYVTLSQVQSLIASAGTVPTGALIPLTGAVVTGGWVIANGQALLRATYPTYWAWVQASGNLAATEATKTHGQYGPGDGSTTFTVPNLYADNGYFIRPMSSGRTIGSVQAESIGPHNHLATFIGNPVPPHTHVHYAYGGGTGGGVVPEAAGRLAAFSYQTDPAGGHTPTGSVSVQNSTGTENRPKNIAYPVLIKT